MRDVFGNGMFATDGCHANIRGFAGFGKGVVARVEVFALLVRSYVNTILRETEPERRIFGAASTLSLP